MADCSLAGRAGVVRGRGDEAVAGLGPSVVIVEYYDGLLGHAKFFFFAGRPCLS